MDDENRTAVIVRDEVRTISRTARQVRQSNRCYWPKPDDDAVDVTSTIRADAADGDGPSTFPPDDATSRSEVDNKRSRHASRKCRLLSTASSIIENL